MRLKEGDGSVYLNAVFVDFKFIADYIVLRFREKFFLYSLDAIGKHQ